ncbi:hypothetical protein BS78_04G289500 [Paspalum vaginatum]|nr:hypothetical protein BS78_04G289500 [Paspalum vaginatum]
MGACGECWLARGVVRVQASLQIVLFACCWPDRFEASDQASFLASRRIHGAPSLSLSRFAWIRLKGLLSGSGSPVWIH